MSQTFKRRLNFDEETPSTPPQLVDNKQSNPNNCLVEDPQQRILIARQEAKRRLAASRLRRDEEYAKKFQNEIMQLQDEAYNKRKSQKNFCDPIILSEIENTTYTPKENNQDEPNPHDEWAKYLSSLNNIHVNTQNPYGQRYLNCDFNEKAPSTSSDQTISSMSKNEFDATLENLMENFCDAKSKNEPPGEQIESIVEEDQFKTPPGKRHSITYSETKPKVKDLHTSILTSDEENCTKEEEMMDVDEISKIFDNEVDNPKKNDNQEPPLIIFYKENENGNINTDDDGFTHRQKYILSERDTRIAFNERMHLYRVDGVQSNFISTTTCLSRFVYGDFNYRKMRKHESFNEYFTSTSGGAYAAHTGTIFHRFIEIGLCGNNSIKERFVPPNESIIDTTLISPSPTDETSTTQNDTVDISNQEVICKSPPNEVIAKDWQQRLSEGKLINIPDMNIKENILNQHVRSLNKSYEVDSSILNSLECSLRNQFSQKMFNDKIHDMWRNFQRSISFLQRDNWVPVASEYMVYDEDIGICGTIDLVIRDLKTNNLIIVDWKTTESVLGGCFKQNVTINDGIMDKYTKYNKYECQLHIYRYILEHKYKQHVDKMIVFLVGTDATNIINYDNNRECKCMKKIIEKIKPS